MNKLKEAQWGCKTQSLFARYLKDVQTRDMAYFYKIKVCDRWWSGEKTWSIPLWKHHEA